MLHTTLSRIRSHQPCATGWRRLLRSLGPAWPDDAPLYFEWILESNGLRDALWCTRAEPQWEPEWRGFGTACLEFLEPLLMPESAAVLRTLRQVGGEDASALRALQKQAFTAIHERLETPKWWQFRASQRAAAQSAAHLAIALACDTEYPRALEAVFLARWAALPKHRGFARWEAAEDACRMEQHRRFRELVGGPPNGQRPGTGGSQLRLTNSPTPVVAG